MAEFQKMRERAREPEPIPPEWEKFLYYMRSWRVRAETGKIIIKGKDIPFSLLEQGYLRNLVAPTDDEAATNNMRMFVHLIPKHSGKHTHQGGYSLFILDGEGYTVVDGVRYDWKAGDLILLPIKKGGCEHQHFNLNPDKPARWLALNPRPMWEMLGAFVRQQEASPAWKEIHGDGVVEGSFRAILNK